MNTDAVTQASYRWKQFCSKYELRCKEDKG